MANITINVVPIERNIVIGVETIIRETTITVEKSIGLPPGGLTGEALIKQSNGNYNAEWAAIVGNGDMLKSTYDPTNVSADSFDMDNMAEGATNKILTVSERAEIASNTLKTGITAQQTTDINTNNGKISYTDAVAVGLNTAKVGISPTQASNITTNNSKIGYTDEAVDAHRDLVTLVSVLQVNIKEFVMHINGSDVTFPTENITLPASQTHYIGYDLLDNSVHYLRRNFQDGMIWVAKVTTGGTTVTDIEQISPVLPKNKIPVFYERLNNGLKDINVALIGDSLIEDVAGTGTGWTNKLFDIAAVSFGFNVPNVARVTEDNYSSGGETSRYGVLWSAKSTKGNAGTFKNDALSYDNVLQQDIFDISDFDVLKDSPIFTNQYDLVIVGFGANGGTYRWAYYEVLIKELRSRGIEVIICSENFRSDNASFLYDQGNIMKAISDEYGCAFADTWVFVQESQDEGNTVLADTIHLTEQGKNAYANSFRTIINDIRLDIGNVLVSDFRSIKEQSDTDLSRNFPNSTEFDCTPKNSTGTLIASSVSDFKNPSVQYGNKPSATSIIELQVGEEAKFAHSYASSLDVVVDGSSAFDLDILSQGGAVIGSVSMTASANIVKVKEGVLLSDYLNVTGNLMLNRGSQIKCTSGTVKLYGVLWHVYKNISIKYSEIDLKGTWAEESWGSRNPNSLYTDTIGDSFTFTYFGSAVNLQLSNRNAAGIVDIYLNGEIVHADLDLFTTGFNTIPIYVTTAPDDYFDIEPSRNIVTVHLKGVNGSAISPVSGNRRLQVLTIKEFDRR